MSHTYEELKHKTVAELREISKEIEHEAVKGATQMNKDHLLLALCTALGIDPHVHHHAVGIDKTAIKTKIHALKNAGLAPVLREIHNLKKRIRRAMV
ncbi:MAG: hypothetical protein AMJ84_06700 [Acidithiobacillales bacterium SM23_46]|nr:MAG: hypothetical protein AMJ84_06700 [Acidithiobacillales bacterium SM23_46]